MGETFDFIGMAAIDLARRYGHDAHHHIDHKISLAIGQHRWDEAHDLNRVKLRLMRLQHMGQLDRLAVPA